MKTHQYTIVFRDTEIVLADSREEAIEQLNGKYPNAEVVDVLEEPAPRQREVDTDGGGE